MRSSIALATIFAGQQLVSAAPNFVAGRTVENEVNGDCGGWRCRGWPCGAQRGGSLLNHPRNQSLDHQHYQRSGCIARHKHVKWASATSSTSTTTTTITHWSTATSAYKGHTSSRPAPTSTHVPDSTRVPQSAHAPGPTNSMAPHISYKNGNYAHVVLHQHNAHRTNHSSNPIKWSSDLADTAHKIALSCVFEHNVDANGGGYGQNIAAGTPHHDIAKVITNEFYNGEEPDFQGLYGLASPPMNHFEQWGHFTQVVWNATEFVGCATVKCPNGVKKVGNNVLPFFTVCNYKPPGNVATEYAKNVGKPLGHPTLTIG